MYDTADFSITLSDAVRARMRLMGKENSSHNSLLGWVWSAHVINSTWLATKNINRRRHFDFGSSILWLLHTYVLTHLSERGFRYVV